MSLPTFFEPKFFKPSQFWRALGSTTSGREKELSLEELHAIGTVPLSVHTLATVQFSTRDSVAIECLGATLPSHE